MGMFFGGTEDSPRWIDEEKKYPIKIGIGSTVKMSPEEIDAMQRKRAKAMIKQIISTAKNISESLK